MSVRADWDDLWKKGFEYGPLDGWARELFLAAGELLGDHPDPRVLSAGCGRGLVDYWFMQTFGWRVELLDYSRQCIANLKKSLKRVDPSRYTLTHGSIFEIPRPDRSFDLVWNEGVLEHFSKEEFEKSLGEMVRTSRRFVLVDVPNANCKPYVLVKAWLESHGMWKWGFEDPKRSLRADLERLGLTVRYERSIGGRRTTDNYLAMVPDAARGEILAQLTPQDYEVYPHLLVVGERRDR